MIKKALTAIFRNFKLKLLAFVIALAIWVYASRNLRDDSRFTVPVSVKLPANAELVHKSVEHVRLHIEGPHGLLQSLDPSYLQMTFQLTPEDVRKGQVRLGTASGLLNIPERDMAQMRITHATPAEIAVCADLRVEQRLPVKVVLRGAPLQGFSIAGHAAYPAEVTVRGPARVLGTIKSIATEAVPVYDLKGAATKRAQLVAKVPFRLPDGTPVSVPVEVEPQTVTVSLNVVEAEDTKIVRNVKVSLRILPDFPYGVELSKENRTVSVILKGRPQELNRLDPSSLQAYVDLVYLASEKIAPGQSAPYQETVKLLPPNIQVSSAQTEPEKVTIILKNPGK